MGTRTRGFITLGIILFVAVVFCGLIPFVVMPSNGIGVALPVITVPGGSGASRFPARMGFN